MTRQSIHLLLIEDDASLCDLVKIYLERADSAISVTPVQSPATGLEKLDQQAIDCIVSDYEMPEMDGLEFLKTVREKYPTLPFILYTGKGSDEIAADAITAGADAYFQKEAGTEQYTVLAKHIDTLVAKHRAEQRLDYLTRKKHIADGGVNELEEAENLSPEDSVSLEVIERIAAHEGVDPITLSPPLQEAIDPDALDKLFDNQPDEPDQGVRSVTFSYQGYRVKVFGKGKISLTE